MFPKKRSALTDEALLDQLKARIPETEQQKLTDLLKKKTSTISRIPQLLVGFGAFFTSIFFIIFLLLAVIEYDSAPAMIITGLLLILSALFLYPLRGSPEQQTVRHAGTSQLALSLLLSGKVILCINSFIHLEGFWSIPVTLLIISLSTAPFIRSAADHLLSALMIGLTSLAALQESAYGASNLVDRYLYDLLILTQLALVILLFLHQKSQKQWLFFAYGFALSLSFYLLAPLLGSLDKHLLNAPPHFIFIKIILTFTLLLLLLWINQDKDLFLKAPFSVLLPAIIVLGMISNAGIIYAIILTVIGYHLKRRALQRLGTILLPLFLFFFYYSLNQTLLEKSLYLFLSGITLLGLAWYLKYWQEHQNKARLHDT
ncbi:DUF4401 domain-containing protein [Magnetococcales bacterium HHB-1]